MVNNPFMVGKTQWAKWNDAGRIAFNEAREAGAGYADALAAANAATGEAEAARKQKKGGGLLGAIGKIAKVAEDVAEVAAVVTPVAAVASTVVKTVVKKGK